MRYRFTSPYAAQAGPARRTLALSCALLLAPLVRPQNSETGGAPDAARAEPVVALLVGHVHPVSGPALEPGVILIAGERITAVGAPESVAIPDGAQRLSFPDGHAYPGLVDALTSAFAEPSLLADASTDAGTPIRLGLHTFDAGAPDLAAAGITTAYVASRCPATWRGLGAVVRPGTGGGFALLPGAEDAAVQLRMTSGPDSSHPLARQAALKAPEQLLGSLEAYEKSLADHEKALEKYADEFEKYLDYHRNKEGGEQGPGGEGQQSEGQAREGRPQQGERSRGGRRGARSGSGRRGGPPQGRGRRGGGSGSGIGEGGTGEGSAAGEEPPQNAKAAGEGSEKAPERPKYPKPPQRDPAKDALLEVRSGKLPLRVEARRSDELRAALELAQQQEIPRLVVEDPSTAAALAGELARRGVPVVLTDILPGSVPDGYGEVDPGGLPARFYRAGAAVAIGSGSAKNARHLPLLAAYAIGHGLPADAALRAITLTPAEVLGIARQLGSLEPGKLADVIVTSGPLFSSDSRVLRVLSSGRTVFEAKS